MRSAGPPGASKPKSRLPSTRSPPQSSCEIIWNWRERGCAPDREPDMRKAFLFLLILLILAAGYFYLSLYQPYSGFTSDGVYVDIPHGASQRTISRLLAENGVVRSRVAFEALCRSRKRRTLEAGEYFFDHPATSFEVFDTLENGRVFVKEMVV